MRLNALSLIGRIRYVGRVMKAEIHPTSPRSGSLWFCRSVFPRTLLPLFLFPLTLFPLTVTILLPASLYLATALLTGLFSVEGLQAENAAPQETRVKIREILVPSDWLPVEDTVRTSGIVEIRRHPTLQTITFNLAEAINASPPPDSESERRSYISDDFTKMGIEPTRVEIVQNQPLFFLAKTHYSRLGSEWVSLTLVTPDEAEAALPIHSSLSSLLYATFVGPEEKEKIVEQNALEIADRVEQYFTRYERELQTSQPSEDTSIPLPPIFWMLLLLVVYLAIYTLYRKYQRFQR